MTISEVDLEYQRLLKSISPAEKVSRSAAMCAWTRQQMARKISADNPEHSQEEIKLRVALKLYERKPEVVKLTEERLESISR